MFNSAFSSSSFPLCFYSLLSLSFAFWFGQTRVLFQYLVNNLTIFSPKLCVLIHIPIPQIVAAHPYLNRAIVPQRVNYGCPSISQPWDYSTKSQVSGTQTLLTKKSTVLPPFPLQHFRLKGLNCTVKELLQNSF